ncbi:MAG: peptide-methionine (S)-S-oxide reductase MsrA [Isosphaeraceae bacterium]|nr:peptide-methionine (S)-S-oxide reductase MsrA [Isosphaeraceae bacterium]
MISRFLVAALGIGLVLGLTSTTSAQKQTRVARAQHSGKAAPDVAKAGASEGQSAEAGQTEGKSETAGAAARKTEKATFGGGCFWCMEAVFERIPGVRAVISGYAGGHVPYPSYEMVHTGLTGHAEVVQIEYDPSVVTYEELLKVFWKSHDPTTLNRQGDDYGTQYRSIILYHNDAQKRAAQQSIQQLNARRAFRHPIVTELVPMTTFFPAEPYHQDYYRNYRFSTYSQIYITPKLKKLKLGSASAPRSR